MRCTNYGSVKSLPWRDFSRQRCKTASKKKKKERKNYRGAPSRGLNPTSSSFHRLFGNNGSFLSRNINDTRNFKRNFSSEIYQTPDTNRNMVTVVYKFFNSVICCRLFLILCFRVVRKFFVSFVFSMNIIFSFENFYVILQIILFYLNS